MIKTMIKIIVFAVVVILALASITLLLGLSTVESDGLCGYTREYGLFSFYRDGGDYGPPEECATGIIISGLLMTLATLIAIAGVVYFSWRKLFKRNRHSG